MKRLFFLFVICTSIFAQKNLTQYVNPFMGTNGHGHVYPGATVPFGMVQLSPDNGRGGWDWCSGYNYSDSLIAGFSHTHLSGTGIGDLCDISFMPTTLPKNFDDSKISTHKFQTKFLHKNEKAEPGFYTVTLDNKVKVELTAALRSGIQRYSFPKNNEAYVQLDLGFAINWDSPVETYIKIESPTRIVGYRLSKGWAEDQRVYFVSEFSKPISLHWLGDDTTLPQGITEYKSKKTKAVFKFDTNQLIVRTAISSVSIANAKANLTADNAAQSFEKTRAAALQQWNKELNKILVKSSDKNLLTTFYTSFYRTMLAPVIFSDVDSSYKSPDKSAHKTNGYTKYSVFSLWDTFRAANPLYTITQPERIDDMINSMLAHFREYGLLPVWELAGNETNCMIGYHAIPVITDAILKGFKGFDVNEAFVAMKLSAMQDQFGLKEYRELGYIPADKVNESVSRTLEYAYDDWCIAQVAKHLGADEDYKTYSSRAEYYKNLFDASTGFMRGKLADGTWRSPFNPKRSDHNVHDYTEGNAWQYSWFVPQDVQGLINLHGGKEKFSLKLDSLFTIDSKVEGDNASPDISGLIGQYAHGNEPSHHTAYMFNFTGEAWKTQKLVTQIMRTLYNHTPDGLCGNEDCGQMSAWFVFSALGFYPFNPADQNYQIGSPIFDEATLTLGNGKKFIISAQNVSAKNIYIESAMLNGKDLSKSSISHNDLLQGGKLILKMGAQPNKQLWN
jgi:predicted alpha-1,2-mannosidase